MKIATFIFLTSLGFATTVIAETPLRPHQVKCFLSAGNCVAEDKEFDWANKTPLEFLDFLKSYYSKEGLGKGARFFTVHAEHCGWLVEQDVAALEELTNSTEPCASVNKSISSYFPIANSTIGHEAMYLIEGYRRGCYPASLNSTRWIPPFDQ